MTVFRGIGRFVRLSVIASLPLLAKPAVFAADNQPATRHDHAAMPGHGHGGMTPGDGREFVSFPPEMRMHQLQDMRDHVAALDGILRALASSDFEKAATLAADRLGLDSPSAVGCKPRPPGAPPPPKGSMEEMMLLYMPARMRAFGLTMHTAASDFAAVARTAGKTRDTRAALGALSQVTRQCVACHAAYRTH